jgi:CubicO group peptidase (beta-lactamase class C family)
LNRVKRSLAAALVLVALATRPTAQPASGFDGIAPIVEAAIAHHELPGAVVLAGRGDQVAYFRAIGRRALEPAPEPMTTDTVFDMASLTKVVATTTSVMQLVEQGRIRLGDTVTRFIPDFGRYG